MVKNFFITKVKEKSTLETLFIFTLLTFPVFFLSSFFMNLGLAYIFFYVIQYSLRHKIYVFIYDKIFFSLILFWFYLVLISLFVHNDPNATFKAIFYLRFIFLYYAIVYILPKINFKLPKLFLTYLIFAIIVSLDVFFQFIFEKNIIGLECQMSCQRNSSFFGEQLIAGTFILFFGVIGLIYFILEKKNNNYFIFALFFFIISIFLTGDRTPFLISILILVLSFFLIKSLRKVFFYIIISSIILIFGLLIFSNSIKNRYIDNTLNILTTNELNSQTLNYWTTKQTEQITYLEKDNNLKNIIDSFINGENIRKEFFSEKGIDAYIEANKNLNKYKNISYEEKIFYSEEIVKYIKSEYNDLNLRKEKVDKVLKIRQNSNTENKWYNIFFDTQYGAHYLTAYHIIKDNFLFGTGIKSFRVECLKYPNINSLSSTSRCSTHPHNMHLEILSETGVLSYLFFLFIIFLPLIIIFEKKNNKKFYLVLIVIAFLSYVFPLKPSGSFFSTFNSFYFWLCFSLIYLLKNFKIKIE